MAQLGISSEDEEGEVESVYTAGVGEGVPGVHFVKTGSCVLSGLLSFHGGRVLGSLFPVS